jgi:hypothetical protein
MAERLAPNHLPLLIDERAFVHNRGNEEIVFGPTSFLCFVTGIPMKLLCASIDHASRMLASPGQFRPAWGAAFSVWSHLSKRHAATGCRGFL